MCRGDYRKRKNSSTLRFMASSLLLQRRPRAFETFAREGLAEERFMECPALRYPRRHQPVEAGRTQISASQDGFGLMIARLRIEIRMTLPPSTVPYVTAEDRVGASRTSHERKADSLQRSTRFQFQHAG